MIRLVQLIIMLLLFSCEIESGNSSTSFDSSNIEIEDKKPKDTLFANYYHGMDITKIGENRDYYFFNNKDSIHFRITSDKRFKLDTLILESKDFTNNDYKYLLDLYKNKYGDFEIESWKKNILAKSNYKISHIYWNNQNSSNFSYDKDEIHTNEMNFCERTYKPKNSDAYRKSGHHIHATNKQNKDNWIFAVDVNKLKDEFVSYNFIKHTFKDSTKMVEIEKSDLQSKRFDNTSKYLDLGMSINHPQHLPNDQINIRYYLIKKEESKKRENEIYDSLNNEQILKNKSDI